MGTAVALENPYWEAIKDKVGPGMWGEPTINWPLSDDPRPRIVSRDDYCRKYAWAVPDPVSVEFVAKWLAPRAVEMGAGLGYWAWMLAQAGVDMLAYDIAPPDTDYTNHWHSPREAGTYHFAGQPVATYYPVRQARTVDLVEHPDRTLFLCWPPYADSMAAECLEAYQGLRLVFIGEGEGGCTGDDAFFAKLSKEWREVAHHRPIQWDGIHDRVYVYERRKRRTRKK